MLPCCKIFFSKSSMNLLFCRVSIFMILIPTIISLLIIIILTDEKSVMYMFFFYLVMEWIQYLLIVSIHTLSWLWFPYCSRGSRPGSTYFWRCWLHLEMQLRAPGLLMAGRWGGKGKSIFVGVKWWGHWFHHHLQMPESFIPVSLGI